MVIDSALERKWAWPDLTLSPGFKPTSAECTVPGVTHVAYLRCVTDVWPMYIKG